MSIRRTAFRYALRSEASLRFEKGQEHRLARLGADRDGPAHRRVGRRRGRAPASSTRHPTAPPPARVAFRPARVDRLLGTTIGTTEQRDLLARVGIATERGADRDARSPSPAGPQPLDVDPARPRSLVATVPTWRRDLVIEADIAEEVARVRGYELRPGHPARHADAALPATTRCACATPSARRSSGAGLTEAVTLALVAPAMVERFGPAGDVTVPGEGERRRRADHRHQPALEPALGPAPEPLGSLSRSSTNVRQGREDVAIFEIGKGYGAPGRASARTSGGGSGSRSPAAPSAGLEPAGAAPYDLDDAKGLIELSPRRLGLPRAAYAAADRRPDPPSGPGRDRGHAPGDGLAGRVGELHPGRRARRSTSRADRIVVAELAIAGLSGGAAARAARPRRRRATRPSSATSRSSSRERPPAAAVADGDPTPRRRRSCARVALFDIYRGRPLGRRRAEPGLPAVVPAPTTGRSPRPRSRRRWRPSRPGWPTSVGGSHPHLTGHRTGPRASGRSALRRAEAALLPLRGSRRRPGRRRTARQGASGHRGRS